MSVTLVEGFDGLRSTELNATPSSGRIVLSGTTGDFSMVAGRTATPNAQAVNLGIASATNRLRLVVPAAARRTIGFAMRFADPGATNTFLFCVEGAVRSIGVRRLSDGRLSAHNSSQLAVLATSTLTVLPNTWYYVEVMFNYPGSGNATCTVRVNGIQAFAVTNSFGGAVASTGISFGQGISAVGAPLTPPQLTFDDCYITDDTDAVAPTGFLGDVKVSLQVPDGTVASTGATANGAVTLHECVDEFLQDGATTFVAAATAGNNAEFSLTNVAAGGGTIFAVQSEMSCGKSDTVARTVRLDQKNATTSVSGPSFTPTQNQFYTGGYLCRSRAPDGGAWTQAKLDDLRLNFVVVS